MQSLPTRKSKQWGSFLAIYTVLIFTALFLAQSILHSKLELKSILALILIALVTAVISCIGGFIGAKIYFLSSSLGLAVGIVYMLYIAIFNASPGWGDLTSVIGFLVFTTIGIIIGLFLETFLIIVKKLKK